ncbi:MAG: ATP-binding cassette domain-containing protein, partial [Caldisericaceae bacterium]|nr:ATP-binding cassette domain-containing protein [Caldisericaceae bacterium]
MLQIKDLSYEIGERRLLNTVNLSVHPGQKIGLIGPNGAGKTTLMRILVGEIKPLAGTILTPRGYKIGYLPQEPVAFEKGTLLGSVLEGHAEIQQIELQILEIQQKLSSGQYNADHQLLKKLGTLQDRFSLLGGYEIESEAQKILMGLGFKESDFLRPLKEFSGGWRMRAYLAKLLLIKPDLLLLDEPTNHLDLPSLEWIEGFLRGFTGSMMVISHDRFFLDRLVQIIAELHGGQLTLYHGNYHFYEQEKAKRRDLLLKQWEEQQTEIQRIQKFIDRFRYKATKAAQVQSRIKRLEKMQRIELPEEDQFLQFKIKAAVQSYKDVLKIEDLYFRYLEEQPWIFKRVNFKIYRGQKIALVGPNGVGKTTLTRLITGELKPVQGKIDLGQRVKVSYYAQHQVDALNLEDTVLDAVQAGAAPEFSGRERDILGVFGFSGDFVEKPIKVLSGGEKARVSLAKILLSPANFLIMDEPTNHLDLKSKEALEFALKNYDGTLLIISHDRYFLDKLVHKVVEIKDGRLFEYEGNYSDYLRLKELRVSDEREITQKSTTRNIVQKNAAKKSKEQKRLEAEARQKISKQRNALNQKVNKLEEQIEKAEKRKTELELQLADSTTYQNSELLVT